MTVELMTAVESFAGSDVAVKRGMQFPSDHPVVIAHRMQFSPARLGEEGMEQQRRELARAGEEENDRQREELRQARLLAGAKWDASDDLNVEAIKKAVRANSDLELIHDPRTGFVTGARTKASVHERRRQAAAREQERIRDANVDQIAAMQAERER